MRLKLTFLRDNLLINDNVLEGSHQAKVQKLVSCLSTCVFPDKVEYPLDETKVHREFASGAPGGTLSGDSSADLSPSRAVGPPHESNFGYAHGKRLVDVQNQCVASPERRVLSADRVTPRFPAPTTTSLALTSPRSSRLTSSARATTTQSEMRTSSRS